MTTDFTFELDQGRRFGPGLVVAATILVAPFVAKAATVAGYIGDVTAAGSSAYWLWVLVGGPLAFLLAQGDVYAVRRVRLVVSPSADRWVLERASLGNASQASGRVQDVVRADVERRGRRVAVRLVGRDDEVLAEVIGLADTFRATPAGRVGLGEGDPRPFRPGESIADVAGVLQGRLQAVLATRPDAACAQA